MKPKSVELVYRCTNSTELEAINAVLTALPQLKAMYAPQGTLTVRLDNSHSPNAVDTSDPSAKG